MKAIIAIGTNLNQRDNALSVREYLGGMFGSDIVFTQFMKTKPVDGGDGTSDVNSEGSLMPSRVTLCAAHQANAVIRIISGLEP